MAKSMMLMFGAAVLVVIFAYVIYDPLPPEDFKEPWRLTIELAAIKFIHVTAKLAETIGYKYPPVSRSIGAFLSSVVPTSVNQSIVRSYDTTFNGVTVRVYEPAKKEKKGRGVVYYHGGGFVIGDLDTYHSQVYRIAKELNAVVVSVHYRRAPEHVFPAAVDDSEIATKYFLQHAAELGVDPSRVAVMGDSAGGNLATVISRRLSMQKFTPMPKLQVLIYPWLQLFNFDLPSYRYNQRGPMVTKELASFFTSWYLFGSDKYRSNFQSNSHVSSEFRNSIKDIMNLNLLPDDKLTVRYRPRKYQDSKIWEDFKAKFTNPDLCPLLMSEEDLKRLPPVYISTCQYDVLRDEALFYIERLKKAGVKVIHDHLKACYHGWTLSHQHSFSTEYSHLIDQVKKNL